MVRRLLRTILATVLLVLGSGCIYSHTVRPVDVDFAATPVMQTGGTGNIKQVTYNNVEVEWGVNGIGEIAKLSGFEEIYYVDLEVLDVLGIWTQSWIHVYGR